MKQPRMKTLIITLLIALAFASCKDDDFKLNDTIRLTGVQSSPVRSAEITDSLAFITRYAWQWYVYSESEDRNKEGRNFGLVDIWDLQRDTVNNRLMLIGSDVIDSYGKLGGFVVDYINIVLTTFIAPDGKPIHARDGANYGNIVFSFPKDTVGYIPNRIVLKAREDITKAFNGGDYAECQRLFDNAFVFMPTTGPKWRALKAAGIE